MLEQLSDDNDAPALLCARFCAPTSDGSAHRRKCTSEFALANANGSARGQKHAVHQIAFIPPVWRWTPQRRWSP